MVAILTILTFGFFIILDLIIRNKKKKKEAQLKSSNYQNNQDSQDVPKLIKNKKYDIPMFVSW